MKESLVDGRSVERLLLVVGALRSGLVDALAGIGPASAEEVAHAGGTDVRASRIVLEALAAEGIVERIAPAGGEEAEPLFRLSALGRAHLVDEGPQLERAGLLHQANKMQGWLRLDEVVRTGRPVPKDWNSFDLRTMVCAMGERGADVLDEIVERCFAYVGSIRTMVDVGGAVGHVARHFARKGVKATLFDRPETLPTAREFLGDEAKDIAMEGGDFRESLPPGPFDLVYFGNVLHIYSPETNARVVRDAFPVVASGGAIAIQDYLWHLSPNAAMFAVNMLRSTDEGGVWTERQHREWLSEAGFVAAQVHTLETTGSQLVLGRRP